MRKCWPPLSIHQSGHSLCSPQLTADYAVSYREERRKDAANSPRNSGNRSSALYEGTSLLQPKRCDFYAHVMLPPHYIPRPEIVAVVRASLLTTMSTAKPTVSRRTHAVALHGMGGIGKTVIAQSTVRRAYGPSGLSRWHSLGFARQKCYGVRCHRADKRVGNCAGRDGLCKCPKPQYAQGETGPSPCRPRLLTDCRRCVAVHACRPFSGRWTILSIGNHHQGCRGRSRNRVRVYSPSL